MIRLAILYFAALGLPAAVLLGRGIGSAGPHWPLAGSALDGWLRLLGPASAGLAALPLLVLAGLAWHRGYRRAVWVCGGLALSMAIVVLALVAVAAR